MKNDQVNNLANGQVNKQVNSQAPAQAQLLAQAQEQQPGQVQLQMQLPEHDEEQVPLAQLQAQTQMSEQAQAQLQAQITGPEITCEARSLTGADPVKVTVGEIFQIECQSESIALNLSQIRFLVQAETKDGKKINDPFTLKLLRADISPQGKWIMQAVSYKVGPVDNFTFEITDGLNTVPVKGVKFQVESVIDQKNPPKGPFGPFGPFLPEFPWGGVAVLVSILLVIILGVVVKSVRLLKKKRLKERMKQYDSPQLPVAQFYGEMRKLEREIDFVFEGKVNGPAATAFIKRLEAALKLFLVRQFQIPAFEWSSSLVIKDFKVRYVWFGEEMYNQLAVLMRELEKSQQQEVAITSQDVHQLLKNLKRWVDRASYMTDKYQMKVSEA